MNHPLKRFFLILCGCLFLTAGIVGIFLPLLPTTPFLLLASTCFLHSSKTLHGWLINHRIFGNYLLAYQRFRAISIRSKALSLALLWACVLYSVLFVITPSWVKAALLLIAAGVTVHLVRLKTLTGEMQAVLDQERYRGRGPARGF